ncbi:hypothetical protein OIU77_006355 [Salix suchowensis]|uniref:Peptidase metallopeptidase domain-containing protein n=1 Tax=Salix suchowensis TaxID=1278906 RepID=A0ABQ9AKN8_9ROSI|nr:hypothetical protein OIU77_006355 [Salix suchowensis]
MLFKNGHRLLHSLSRRPLTVHQQILLLRSTAAIMGTGTLLTDLGEILAHAFFPQDGRLHYDADENWSTNPAMDQTDLESVSVHEIGHLLGLYHSTDRESIMYPSIHIGRKKRDLTQDDIDGIHALYHN